MRDERDSGDHWTVVPSLTITGALDVDNPRAVVTIAEVRG